MRVINDFKCTDCGLVTEKYIENTVRVVECECGGKANWVICVPRAQLDGTDPSLPGAYDKWGRDREKRAAQHHKKNG
jgi:hypothetical protein